MQLPNMELKDFNYNSIIELLDLFNKPIITNNNINNYIIHGIRFGLAKEYEGDLVVKFNWNGKVNTFTEEMSRYILEKHYWYKIQGSNLLSIHRLLADRMMDFAVNTSVEIAIKSLCIVCNAVSSNGEHWPTIQVKEEMDYELITTLRKIFQVKGNDAISVIIAMLFSTQVKAIMNDGILGPYTKDAYEACQYIFYKQTWYAGIVLALE